MIAVLGPAELATAVAAAVRGELVVGAADDEGLGGPIEEAASSAAELPLPVRACVVAAADPAEACARVRAVGGALRDATVYLVGTPTDVTAEQWEQAARVWDAVPARDVDELAERLTGIEVRGTPVNGRRGRRRPGAPDEAAWREWLSASPKRRGLPFARRPQPGRLRRRDEAGLDAAIRRPLDPSCRIAVASPKGGVGKTLLSFLLGSVLAQLTPRPHTETLMVNAFWTARSMLESSVARSNTAERE